MDTVDLNILERLQHDARITNVALAEAVHLSPAPCLRRVRELEASGVIHHYTTLLDAEQLGWQVSVFIEIRLERQVVSDLKIFEEHIESYPEVMECYLMTGEFDYLLRVVVADMADFERLHKEALTRLPGVARVNSSVAIRTVQKKTELPLRS